MQNDKTPQADVISAFEWCEKHIPCFDANDNYYKKVIKSLENRHAATRLLERAKWSDEHVRVVNAAYVKGKEEERARVKELVESLRPIFQINTKDKSGSAYKTGYLDAMHDMRNAVEKFQTPEGVS